MDDAERKRHIRGYVLGVLGFLVFFPALIVAVARASAPLFPAPFIGSDVLRIGIAAAFFASGAVFAAWSNLDLFRVGRGGPFDFCNVAVSPRTRALVVSGPYLYTRNPMVFGTIALYSALAVFLNSAGAVLFLALFLVVIVLYLKRFEEKRLLRDFGDEYRAYRKRVPMIFPLPPRLRGRRPR